MPFVVKHTNVGGLVETAARAAGARQQATRESQAAAMRRQQDAQAASFQRQQMAIAASQQQAQQAQAASAQRQQEALQYQMSRAQASDEFKQQEISMRATALQDASAARIARTSRSRTEGTSPVAASIKARLEALNKLKERGGVSDAEFRRSSQEIVTGRRAPTPQRPRKTSAAEVRRDNADRGEYVEGIRQLHEAMTNPDLSPEERERATSQYVEYTGQATERWGRDWANPKGLPYRAPRKPKVDTRGVPSMPAKEDIVPGKVVKVKTGPYKGRDVFWNEKVGKFQLVS